MAVAWSSFDGLYSKIPKELTLLLIPEYLDIAHISRPLKPFGEYFWLKLTSDDLTEFKSKVTMSASLSKGSTKPIDCEISPKR